MRSNKKGGQVWLKRAGEGLRLPSESEWEYACRAGTSTRYFWDDEPDDSYYWHADNCEDQVHAAIEHTEQSNAFGLVDMSGNVYEWCQDSWIDSYNEGPSNELPRKYEDVSERVLRGGSWGGGEDNARSAYRLGLSVSRYDDIGFRLARRC